MTGDVEAAGGATWTYESTDAGVVYTLQGILLNPRGTGPFPAVIISHGAGANATGYSRAIAMDMLPWGMVCIATNYTHAGGAPMGSPGTILEPGASQANVLRARKLLDLLATLGYVDLRRVAAHGHSMGAFVTTALVSVHPDLFRVASPSAGGVRPGAGAGDAAAPTEAQASGIRAPYQLHHGDADEVVPFAFDQRLDDLLRGRGIERELHVYRGAQHNDVSRSSEVLSRIRTWYAAHGMCFELVWVFSAASSC